MIETKHHEPLVYKIYEFMKSHVGEENAIQGRDLAANFTISERQLRSHIHEIRKSDELTRIILSSNRGYFMATEEEFDRYNKRLESQAISLLKVFHSNRKKAGKDGQYKIPLGEYYAKIFEAYGE